jgi:pseudaminic acid biosynthesis-associated methylase
MSETVDFWRGDFGRDYTKRNRVRWADRVPLLSHVVELTGATSFLDVGCNAGWNMQALRSINPELMMSGLDVNLDALKEAQAEGFDVSEGRADQAEEIFGHGAADLVVTSGVLIHIAPDDLVKSMKSIKDASKQWVLAIEYYAQEETEINYRGNAGRLWSRPYARFYEALGLSLVETGDASGYDSCQYWLMSKD